jgi:hypothetical protein
MPNSVPVPGAGRRDSSGFLKHPTNFPLEFRRLRSWARWRWRRRSRDTGPGLCFFSGSFVPVGEALELSIALRGGPQRFVGRVVFVRELRLGYQLGVRFARAEDAARVRTVERICRLECAIRTRRRRTTEPAPSHPETSVQSVPFSAAALAHARTSDEPPPLLA